MSVEIVCPHCGHEFRDSWDYGDSGEIECTAEECGKPFFFERVESVDYETRKLQ